MCGEPRCCVTLLCVPTLASCLAAAPAGDMQQPHCDTNCPPLCGAGMLLSTPGCWHATVHPFKFGAGIESVICQLWPGTTGNSLLLAVRVAMLLIKYKQHVAPQHSQCCFTIAAHTQPRRSPAGKTAGCLGGCCSAACLLLLVQVIVQERTKNTAKAF